MKRRILKNIEWGILICAIILTIIGLVALTSATKNSDYDELKRQVMWLVISIPVMIVIIFIDYDIIAKISPVLYGIIIIMLIGVLFTEPINGASSWFTIGQFTLQPAEFAKIICILMLALVITKIQSKGKNELSRPTRLLLVLLVFAVPTLLIIYGNRQNVNVSSKKTCKFFQLESTFPQKNRMYTNTIYILFYKKLYYSSFGTGAPFGHTPAHIPQPMQSDSSITYLSSPFDIHCIEHASAQAPQLIHFSVIL